MHGMNILEIYFYTIKIAFFSTLISVIFSIPIGFFIARRRFFGRKILLSFSAIPLCVPSLIVALGYVNFWGINGIFNRFFNTEFSLLYSFYGIIIVQGFYNFPYITKNLVDVWINISSEQKNSARLLGASEFRVFFTITLKQISGAIVSSSIPVFLYCFLSFMIVLLFSPPNFSTLEVEIYHSFTTTLDIEKGVILAIVETFTAFLLIFGYSFVLRKNQIYALGTNFLEEKRKSLKWEIFPFLIIMTFVFFFFVFPLFSVFLTGLINFPRLFFTESFFPSLLNSFKIGFFTGFFCTILGFFYSIFIRLSKLQKNVFLQTIPLFPMAISSVVISWCSNLIFKNSNQIILVILETFLFWPVSYRQIQNHINSISEETINAAKILSKNRFDLIFRFFVLNSKRILFSGFCYSFAISLGDATIPLVLSIRNFNSLALMTYKLASSYKFELASSCGTIIAFISMSIWSFKSKRKE